MADLRGINQHLDAVRERLDAIWNRVAVLEAAGTLSDKMQATILAQSDLAVDTLDGAIEQVDRLYELETTHPVEEQS